MRIGLFFGTFNPIHNGHLMMANYVLNHTDVDIIEFVISPESPFKEHNGSIVDFKDRLKMVTNACHYTKSMIPSDIEKFLSNPTYTANTLKAYRKRYKTYNDEYVLIIGADTFKILDTFFNAEEILALHRIVVINRDGIDCNEKLNNLKERYEIKDIEILDNCPQCNLSSTFIRNEIRENKSIDFYVPPIVNDYIKTSNLYK